MRHENLSVNNLRVNNILDASGNNVTGGISPSGGVVVFDDFMVLAGNNIDAAKWTWDGDTETTANVLSQGGDVEITTSVTDNEGASLLSAQSMLCTYGNVFMETRLFLKTAITNEAVFIGFTDSASIEEPLLNTGTTLTSAADDCVGFLYDVDSTTEDWMLGNSIAGTAGTPATHTGIFPVAGTYQTFRVEIDIAAGTKFYLNGNLVGSIATALTTTDPLFAGIVMHNRSAASHVVTCDYLMYGHDRA